MAYQKIFGGNRTSVTGAYPVMVGADGADALGERRRAALEDDAPGPRQRARGVASATSASGSSGRWSRSAPRRATRRPGSPTWCSSPGSPGPPSTSISRTSRSCFLAAVEALVEPTIAVIERAEDAPTGEARLRQAVEAFLGLIADQPAASKMCFIEVYAAGPAGEAAVERALDIFERFGVSQLNQIPDRKGMPPQMVRAMVGGLQKVIQKRLYRDEADELPRLAEPDHRLGPLLPAAARPARGPAPARPQSAPLRRAPGGRPPARAGPPRARRDRRREGLRRDHRGRDRRAGQDLAARLLRPLRQQGRGLPRRPRQRLGADARPRSSPPSAAPRAGRTRSAPPTRRCSPSRWKSPSTPGSARSRCTRSANGRCAPATR